MALLVVKSPATPDSPSLSGHIVGKAQGFVHPYKGPFHFPAEARYESPRQKDTTDTQAKEMAWLSGMRNQSGTE